MKYQVTAPLVIVRADGASGPGSGPSSYIYEGGVLPEYVQGEQLKQLLDQGMVARLDSPAAAAAAASDAPAKSASRGDWEDYAVATGMSREDAEAFSNKDELIAAVSG